MVLPSSLMTALQKVEGFDETSFIEAHQQPPPVSIRFNPSKWNEKFAEARLKGGDLKVTSAVPWSSLGKYLSYRPIFTVDPSLHAGAYYVQEASSMFLEYLLQHLLGKASELKCLDLCAAPGGKTTLLASMEQFGLVVANEIIKTRVSILLENVVKWGDPKIFVTNDDPSHFSRVPGYFDVLIVDAPCSGSGLFRKDEAALNEWSVSNVMHCAERQKRILADAIPSLSSGGILVYSTCSYSPEEDEAIIEWLMEKFPLQNLTVPVPEEWGVTRTQTTAGAEGYRFFPGKTAGEGFFVAAFQLKEQIGGSISISNKSMAKRKSAISPPEEWINPNYPTQAIEAGDEVYLIPEQLIEDHLALREVLSVRKSGVKAGQWIRNDFLPDHELVLSQLVSPKTRGLSVDRQIALQYLRKQQIEVDSSRKGWHILQYEGLNLGLIKHLGNRINNYYPASWRILMS